MTHPLMDGRTAVHFQAWMDRAVPVDDQDRTLSCVYEFLKDHGDLVDKGRTWSEIRDLAERTL